MIVIAGPPGSGKTRYFPLTAFGADSFNIDDRCAQILGSYRAIPREIRRAVAKECERFVLDHIEHGRSFAVETTLRTTAAIGQAELAHKAGFATQMRFVATDSIAENVTRVLQRAQAGDMVLPSARSARSTMRASRTCDGAVARPAAPHAAIPLDGSLTSLRARRPVPCAPVRLV